MDTIGELSGATDVGRGVNYRCGKIQLLEWKVY